jgi:hypothetical protein
MVEALLAALVLLLLALTDYLPPGGSSPACGEW